MESLHFRLSQRILQVIRSIVASPLKMHQPVVPFLAQVNPPRSAQLAKRAMHTQHALRTTPTLFSAAIAFGRQIHLAHTHVPTGAATVPMTSHALLTRIVPLHQDHHPARRRPHHPVHRRLHHPAHRQSHYHLHLSRFLKNLTTVVQILKKHLLNVNIHARQKHQPSVLMACSVSQPLHALALSRAPTFVEVTMKMRLVIVLFHALADLLHSAQLNKVVMRTHPAPSTHQQPRNPSKMRFFQITQRFQLNLITVV